jgi:hypothetical protein
MAEEAKSLCSSPWLTLAAQLDTRARWIVVVSAGCALCKLGFEIIRNQIFLQERSARHEIKACILVL